MNIKLDLDKLLGYRVAQVDGVDGASTASAKVGNKSAAGERIVTLPTAKVGTKG